MSPFRNQHPLRCYFEPRQHWKVFTYHGQKAKMSYLLKDPWILQKGLPWDFPWGWIANQWTRKKMKKNSTSQRSVSSWACRPADESNSFWGVPDWAWGGTEERDQAQDVKDRHSSHLVRRPTKSNLLSLLNTLRPAMWGTHGLCGIYMLEGWGTSVCHEHSLSLFWERLVKNLAQFHSHWIAESRSELKFI